MKIVLENRIKESYFETINNKKKKKKTNRKKKNKKVFNF